MQFLYFCFLNVFVHENIENKVFKMKFKDHSLTFRRGAGAVRHAGNSVWRASAVAAECHQPPDDGGLAGPGIAHDDGAPPLAAAGFSQDLLQTCEEPIPADKRRLVSDAGDFEQQRFEHDVGLFYRRQPHRTWRSKVKQIEGGSFFIYTILTSVWLTLASVLFTLALIVIHLASVSSF